MTNTRVSVGNFGDKGLNFARSKSHSDNLEEQARDLISAMEADPTIDMNNNWKVRDLT